MTKQYHISLLSNYAAALCNQRVKDDDGNWVQAISHDDAKRMTAAQVASLFEVDHVVPIAIGGSDHHSNIVPRLIGEHRNKTHTVDRPAIRREARLSKSYDTLKRRRDLPFAPSQADAEGSKCHPAGIRRPPPQKLAKLKGRRFRGWRKFNGQKVWRNTQGTSYEGET